jgi:hypothetical protein
VQAHLGAKVDGKLTMPNMPDLLTGPADDPDGVTLALPDNSSVPLPQLPGMDLSRGVAAAVEGGLWEVNCSACKTCWHAGGDSVTAAAAWHGPVTRSISRCRGWVVQ